MDSVDEADAPVENFKLVASTLAKYNSQKLENERLIVQLERITEQLKSLYNVEFNGDYLSSEVTNGSEKGMSEHEVAAEKLMSLSNENYKILNNLQYQLKVRNKLIMIVREYSKLIQLIEDYLLVNDFEIYKSSPGNNKLIRILKDDLEFLEKKNKISKNTDYKNMYTSLSLKLRDILESLEKYQQ